MKEALTILAALIVAAATLAGAYVARGGRRGGGGCGCGGGSSPTAPIQPDPQERYPDSMPYVQTAPTINQPGHGNTIREAGAFADPQVARVIL